MAAMSTALTLLTSNGNGRKYFYTGHIMAEPRLVIQTFKEAASATSFGEDVMKVVSSTEDANGDLLTGKVSLEAKVRRPANGIAGDVTAALAVFRDIVASDEFTAMVTAQSPLA